MPVHLHMEHITCFTANTRDRILRTNCHPFSPQFRRRDGTLYFKEFKGGNKPSTAESLQVQATAVNTYSSSLHRWSLLFNLERQNHAQDWDIAKCCSQRPVSGCWFSCMEKARKRSLRSVAAAWPLRGFMAQAGTGILYRAKIATTWGGVEQVCVMGQVQRVSTGNWLGKHSRTWTEKRKEERKEENKKK